MNHRILMDEFQLHVTAPAGLPEKEYMSIVRILRNKRFRAKLLRAIRGIFSAQAPFRHVRVTLDS